MATGDAKTLAVPPSYNDERFERIHSQARELKGILRELNEMTYLKADGLLGPLPDGLGKVEEKNPENCWADRVINEQSSALAVCRDTLQRLQAV